MKPAKATQILLLKKKYNFIYKERKKYVIQYEAGRIELIYEPFVRGASVKCIPALYHTAKIKNTYIKKHIINIRV